MTIKVRSITCDESSVLDQWQRGDDVVRYRRARILRLSEATWRCLAIADALALHVETVRDIVQAFNEGGIPSITPRPRSGGRRPSHGEEVAKAAEDLVHQGPPEEEGRATWTLHRLAATIADRFEQIDTLSHESVRRLLRLRNIVYRLAKRWLTSPDPLYSLHKSQRDRMLALARAAPDGVAIWLDQSWFVLWPYRIRAWARRDHLPRVAQRWKESVDTTALYAALDDETQEAFLRWAAGQPNSEETIWYLEALMAHWTDRRKRFLVLFWDRAPWHTSRRTRGWIRDYNRRAKSQGLTRLLVCFLPTRSPWLMPLETIFGWIKHQTLGDRLFPAISDLQDAVEDGFRRRVAQAKLRRDKAWAAAIAA